jgi:two-component system, cell cycle response regulator
MGDNTGRITDRTMQLDRSTVAEHMRKAKSSGRRKACFVVMGGLDVGCVHILDKRVSRIGRDPAGDVVLRDDGISRVHAEVRRLDDSRLYIKDLDSTNGIFVGGERVEEAVLREGDKVLLGRRTVLKFALHDELEQNYQQQMYESSTRDGLTGVFNRKYFSQKINSDISFARRHKIPFSLLMLDIDYFKKVNDNHGHRTGDQVLVTVTEIIARTIRTEDTLARYGGEEFAVLAQGTGLEGGIALGERIRANIEKHVILSLGDTPEQFRVTASIGVASLHPGVEAEPEAVVSLADKNLYAAKEQGRNRVVAAAL